MQSILLGNSINRNWSGQEKSDFPAFRALDKCATLTVGQIVESIALSGLAGKGGAAFPMAEKIRMVAQQEGSEKFVVVNGSEHEPGSLKDRFILEHFPNKVIEGALISAWLVNASKVVIAINQDATESIKSVNAYLALCIKNLPGLELLTKIEVVSVPDSYIVGEETALLEVLEGKEALPRDKPPYPVVAGLNGAPTLINNVETLAHLPYIIEYGPQNYRNLGRFNQGLTFCTIGEEFANAGVYEVEIGVSLRELVFDLGGGLKNGTNIKAVQIGSPSSGFILASNLNSEFSSGSLNKYNASLGCGTIRGYSEADCMVEKIGEIMNFFAEESCGQCPSCRMETQMLNNIVGQISTGKGTWKLVEKIPDIIDFSKSGGKCGLIKMPGPIITSGVGLFRNEFSKYIDDGKDKSNLH